jgi:hypothetical protein
MVINTPLQVSGYQAAGRWFRYVATTVTVPPRTLPCPEGGSAFIGLNLHRHRPDPGRHAGRPESGQLGLGDPE